MNEILQTPPKNTEDMITRFGKHFNYSDKIICMVGSVITNVERFKHFKDMIDSVSIQTEKIDLFFLSIYIDPKLGIDKQEVNDMLTKLPSRSLLLRQKRPKKQFAQYRHMVSHLYNKEFDLKKTWLMFSDDDAIWNTTRVQTLLAAANTIPLYDEISSGVFTSICMPENVKQKKEKCCEIHSASDVNKAANHDCITYVLQTGEDIQNNANSKRGVRVNHQEFMVRPALLIDFLRENKYMVENNRFSNMDFRIFASTYKTDQSYRTMYVPPSEWLYFSRSQEKEYDDTHTALLKVVDMAMTRGMNFAVESQLQEYIQQFKLFGKEEKKFRKEYKDQLTKEFKKKMKYDENTFK